MKAAAPDPTGGFDTLKFNSKYAAPRGAALEMQGQRQSKFVSFRLLSNFFGPVNDPEALSVEEEYIFENFIIGPGADLLKKDLADSRRTPDPKQAFMQLLDMVDPKPGGRNARQTKFWFFDEQPIWGIIARKIYSARNIPSKRKAIQAYVNKKWHTAPITFVSDVPAEQREASMYKHLTRKFRDPTLAALLLATGNATLEEVSMRGHKPTSGRLGRLLTTLRARLRQAGNVPSRDGMLNDGAQADQHGQTAEHTPGGQTKHGCGHTKQTAGSSPSSSTGTPRCAPPPALRQPDLERYRQWLATQPQSHVQVKSSSAKQSKQLHDDNAAARTRYWTDLTGLELRRHSGSKLLFGSIRHAAKYRELHQEETVICLSLASKGDKCVKLSTLDHGAYVGDGHAVLSIETLSCLCASFHAMDARLPPDVTLFIHCKAGLNRSCALVVSLIMGKQQKSFHESVGVLMALRKTRAQELSVRPIRHAVRRETQEALSKVDPAKFRVDNEIPGSSATRLLPKHQIAVPTSCLDNGGATACSSGLVAPHAGFSPETAIVDTDAFAIDEHTRVLGHKNATAIVKLKLRVGDFSANERVYVKIGESEHNVNFAIACNEVRRSVGLLAPKQQMVWVRVETDWPMIAARTKQSWQNTMKKRLDNAHRLHNKLGALPCLVSGAVSGCNARNVSLQWSDLKHGWSMLRILAFRQFVGAHDTSPGNVVVDPTFQFLSVDENPANTKQLADLTLLNLRRFKGPIKRAVFDAVCQRPVEFANFIRRLQALDLPKVIQADHRLAEVHARAPFDDQSQRVLRSGDAEQIQNFVQTLQCVGPSITSAATVSSKQIRKRKLNEV